MNIDNLIEYHALKIKQAYLDDAGGHAIWELASDAMTTICAAAAAAERERCARVCEGLTARRAAEMGMSHYDHLTGYRCAAAIRALE